MAPDEVVEFEVTAKQRFDGQAIERPITGTMSGPRTLEPSATPVDPPAAFTFTGGSEPGDTGTITLEQRSVRGIGNKTLAFEVEDRSVVVSVAATADWVPGGGVEAHGEMTIAPTTAAIDGSRTDATANYAETFSVGIGIGSCQADYDAAIPAALIVEQDEASRTTFRVVLEIVESGAGDTAMCQAAGVSTEVPINAELFLFAWGDSMQDGVAVELGQTAVVEGTDASGQIAYRVEITVEPASE